MLSPRENENATPPSTTEPVRDIGGNAFARAAVALCYAHVAKTDERHSAIRAFAESLVGDLEAEDARNTTRVAAGLRALPRAARLTDARFAEIIALIRSPKFFSITQQIPFEDWFQIELHEPHRVRFWRELATTETR
jgi:hypothetical protein